MKKKMEKSKHDVGVLGEDAAVKYLKKNKYKIIGRNVQAGKSEFDVIAAKDDTLAFVEVKTRTYSSDEEALTRPADAVNKEKISYLIRGVNNFCREYGENYSELCKRIDIIEVYLKYNGKRYAVTEIKHFENAAGKQR